MWEYNKYYEMFDIIFDVMGSIIRNIILYFNSYTRCNSILL